MFLKEDARLQEHFRLNEFMTNLDSQLPSEQVKVNLTKLSFPAQELRTDVGEIRITSGWRSKEYNDKIKGSPNSFHIDGLAMDCEFIKRVNGRAVEDYGNWTVDTLLPLLNRIGFSNVGFYVRSGKFQWIHLDIGKTWGNSFGWSKYSDTLSYRIIQV